MATPVPGFAPVNTQQRVQASVTRLEGNFDAIQAQLELHRTTLNQVITEVQSIPGAGTGVVAAAYAFPASITVNQAGAITAIVAGSQPLESTARGVANGVASLDATGRIPTAQLPAGVFEFQGIWDAQANTPTLTSGQGINGHAYIVGTPGTTNLDGTSSWALGDVALFNGIVWEKLDAGAFPATGVTSYNGRTGVIIPLVSDIAQFTLSQLNSRITDGNLDFDSATRPPSGTASGDLTGTYPSPAVAALRGRSVSTLAPTTGQVLRWNGTEWAPHGGVSSFVSLTGDVSQAQFQQVATNAFVPVMGSIAETLNAVELLTEITTEAATVVGNAIANARVQVYSASTLPAAAYDSANGISEDFVPLAPQTVTTPEPYVVVVLPSTFAGNDFMLRVIDSSNNEVTDERIVGVGTAELQFVAFAGTVTNGARAFWSRTMMSLEAGDQLEVAQSLPGTLRILSGNVRIDEDSVPEVGRDKLAGVIDRAIFNRLDVTESLEDLAGILTSTTADRPAVTTAATNFKAYTLPAAAGVTTLPRANDSDWSTVSNFAPLQGVRHYLQLSSNVPAARARLADQSVIDLVRIGTFRFGEDVARNVVDVFYFDTPDVLTAAQLTGVITIETFVQPLEEITPDYQLKISAQNLNAALTAKLNTPPDDGDALSFFRRDLSRTTKTGLAWETVTPNPYSFTLGRLAAAFWDENRHLNQGNYFEDNATGLTIDVPASAIAYYPPGTTNARWPGEPSFADGAVVTIRNETAGQSAPIDPNNYNLILLFSYRFEKSSYPAGPILQFGARTPVLLFDRSDGLQANIGRQDGGQIARDITEPLEVLNPNWGTITGQSTAEVARGLIPFGDTGPGPGFFYPVTVSITIERFTGDASDGTDTHTYVITAESTDQPTPTPQTYTFGGNTLDVEFTYDGNVTGLRDAAQNVVLVSTTANLTDPNVHYKVSMTAPRSTDWFLSNSFDTRSINAGRITDGHGNFDPERQTTFQPFTANDVMVVFSKFDLDDISPNPEIVAQFYVDGEDKNYTDSFTRLFRGADDLGFVNGQINDLGIKIGETGVQVGHIQAYYWTGTKRPTPSEVTKMFTARQKWLGAFRNSRAVTDAFTLQGNLQLVVDGNTRDIGTKLAAQTQDRVTLSTDTLGNVAGQNYVFAINPTTFLPWQTTDFDEILVEHTVVGEIYTRTVRARVADAFVLGTAITVDLNNDSIDFNAAGGGHHVIGIRYV